MGGLLFFLFLLGLGFFFGRMNERNHYKSIEKREKELAHITVSDIKHIPDGVSQSNFVNGNVVVSVDYFKLFAASLRNIFGGQIKSYSSLLERARREAVLRMKEQAQELGASHIANVRLETASVFKNAKNTIGSVEVFAYGTALK